MAYTIRFVNKIKWTLEWINILFPSDNRTRDRRELIIVLIRWNPERTSPASSWKCLAFSSTLVAPGTHSEIYFSRSSFTVCIYKYMHAILLYVEGMSVSASMLLSDVKSCYTSRAHRLNWSLFFTVVPSPILFLLCSPRGVVDWNKNHLVQSGQSSFMKINFLSLPHDRCVLTNANRRWFEGRKLFQSSRNMENVFAKLSQKLMRVFFYPRTSATEFQKVLTVADTCVGFL